MIPQKVNSKIPSRVLKVREGKSVLAGMQRLKEWSMNKHSLWFTSQFIECYLDTLEAPVFAQHCHGLEEGWGGGAPGSRHPQQAEKLPCFQSQLGGERTKREFER
jgi:hypothetical protein